MTIHCDQSLFFSVSKRSACARARASLPSRAFHHARGYFHVWGVELDRLRNKIDSSSLNVRRLIQTLSSQNKL